MGFLGTGITRLVNMGLILVLAGGLIFGAYHAFTHHYVNIGRNQVTNQVNAQNNALDNQVNAVNTQVVHDVTHTTDVINHKSEDVIYVVKNSPVEPLAPVTRNRLNVVHDQQQSVRKTS
jgi:hypothetical protein